jgi:hypothetical protein
MITRANGGGMIRPWDTGLDSVGLLITVWGRVTAIGSDCFYLDDGSAVSDGLGVLGVKVHTRSLTKPSLEQYAVVTGMCSTEADGSETRRVIRPRVQADLIYR